MTLSVGDGANDVAHHANWTDGGLGAHGAAGHQIAVTADIFGQRINHQIGAVPQRFLPKGAQKGVVNDDRGPRGCIAQHRGAGGGDRLDVHQCVGRVGRAFQINEGDVALGLGGDKHGLDFGLRSASREIQPGHAELAQDAADQGFGSRVEGR